MIKYLQYFCGLKSFQVEIPFDASLFVDIRKRMGASFEEWNKQVIEVADRIKPPKDKNITRQEKDSPNDDSPNGDKSENKGKIIVDATVADQEITYPTDATLLNRVRLESERLIDLLCKINESRKPRTYRRIAKKEFRNFSKKKRKSKKQIRKFIRKQLGYIRRNLKHIDLILNKIDKKNEYQKFPLSRRDQKIYWVIQVIFDQQLEMYNTKTNRIAHRIVNIYQPCSSNSPG